MLGNEHIVPGICELPKCDLYFHLQDDLTATLVQQCRRSQITVQRIVETAGDNEAILFEALNVNDEILKVLTKYEELKPPPVAPLQPEPAMIPVAVEPDESPRHLDDAKEDSLIRKPAGSRPGVQGGNNDDMMDDLDEMIFGSKVGGASDGGHDTKNRPWTIFNVLLLSYVVVDCEFSS
jgi:hypothetical protein